MRISHIHKLAARPRCLDLFETENTKSGATFKLRDADVFGRCINRGESIGWDAHVDPESVPSVAYRRFNASLRPMGPEACHDRCAQRKHPCDWPVRCRPGTGRKSSGRCRCVPPRVPSVLTISMPKAFSSGNGPTNNPSDRNRLPSAAFNRPQMRSIARTAHCPRDMAASAAVRGISANWPICSGEATK